MFFSSQLFRSLNRWLGWLLVVLILTIALLTVAVRQLLPAVSEYRVEIEQYLSERMRTQVTIGDINASWEGRFPTLLIQDVLISDHRSRNIGQISVDQIVLGLNPVSSLVQLQPVLSRVEIWSLHSKVDFISWPDPAKKKATSSATTKDSAADPLALLWLQPHIFFYDTRLDLSLPSGAELELRSPAVNLENSQSQHHFSGELLVEYEEKTAAAILKIESDSYRFDPKTTNFDFYMSLAGVDNRLLQLSRELFPLPAELEQLELNSEIWGNWSDGRLTKIFGNLDSDRIQVSATSEQLSQPLLIQDLSTDFALLQPQRGHFQLQVSEFSALVDGHSLLLPQLVIDRQKGQVHSVSLDVLDLDKTKAFAQSQSFVPENISALLEKVSPEGVLHNISVKWPHTEKTDWLDLKFEADLDAVGFAGVYGAPAMSGIDGLLQMNYSAEQGLEGRVDLESEQLGLHFPSVFKQGWVFDSARGVTHISLKQNILHLQSEHVELQKPGINAAGRWSLYLPLAREIQSELTLLIGLKGSDASLAPELIPDYFLDPGIKRWVSQSVKKGHLNQGGFMLHTGTRDIPSLQSPRVQLYLDIADANIDYQPGWPEVTNASAGFLLRDQGMQINLSDGKIKNSDIAHSWLYLAPGSQNLRLIGQVNGGAGDIFETLLESPVMSGKNRELADWTLSGQATTDLRLSIPLRGGEPDIDVGSSFTQLTLASDKRNLSFSKLAGGVGYQNDKGLYSSAIKGQFFGYPLTAEISTSGSGVQEKIRTRINSTVRFDQLRKWSGVELLALAEGVQPYQADLDICIKADCSGLTVRSDLAQSQLNLIAPFSKAKGAVKPLLLRTDFSSPQTFNIALGEKLRAWLQLKDDRLSKGALVLGGQEAKPSSYAGLSIQGELDRLDYEQLSMMLSKGGILADGQTANAGSDSKSAVSKGQDGKGKSDIGLAVQGMLHIGSLSYQDMELNAVKTELNREPNSWLISLSGLDLDSQIIIPDDAQVPPVIRFEYLNLDRLLATKALSEAENPVTNDANVRAVPDQPGNMPDLDIEVNNLVLKEKRWGNWGFNVRNRNQTTYIENITGEMPGLNATGQLVWKPGTTSVSELTLKIEAGNLDQALTSAGFDSVMKTKSMKTWLVFSWLGAPWDYSIDDLSGSAKFTARDGRIVSAGGSSGFLRVFGILNMNALGRRLKLDFADLFAKGIAFDKMQGDYRIINGVATSNEPFVLRGPSVDMAMSGDIDLVHETVNKQMAVTLPVTDNLPLAAFLLGAPQVAGVAFLLDKLIGDKVKKEIATVTYTMEGDWSDPKVELLQQNKEANTEPSNKGSAVK